MVWLNRWGILKSPAPNSSRDDHDETKFLRHPVVRYAYEKSKNVCEPRRREISSLLSELTRYIPVDNSLPPLGLAELDDGSVLLEWTFKDRRLGFTFETDPNDSGWYYVFSRGRSEHYESGTMDQLEIERLVSKALKP